MHKYNKNTLQNINKKGKNDQNFLYFKQQTPHSKEWGVKSDL